MSTDWVAADSHSPVHYSTGHQALQEAVAETASIDSERVAAHSRLRQEAKVQAASAPKSTGAGRSRNLNIELVAETLSRLELDSAR